MCTTDLFGDDLFQEEASGGQLFFREALQLVHRVLERAEPSLCRDQAPRV